MIVVAVEYQCDWKGCDATHVSRAPAAPGARVEQPESPAEWVRVDDRIYCPRHQIFIRPRDEDAPWCEARWVEEGGLTE